MTTRPSLRIAAMVYAAIVVAAACGKTPPIPPPPPPPAAPPGLPPAPKPEPIRLTLQASDDVNPDAANRPSPVVVRLYLLKADALFMAGDFFALYDDEKSALKDDLIAKSTEFTLRPGESTAVPEFVPSPETRFLGVIAAYRDYRNAQWRRVAPLPLAKGVTIAVRRGQIELIGK